MTNQSEALYERAVKLMPAGVNSPVRAFGSVGGTPLYMARGEGPYMFDADGKRYLDFCCSWGPLILGHTHPVVREAIERVVAEGWTFGTPVSQEVDLASLIQEQLPEMEMMRFVNSGTEGVMSAIRLARGFTGRDRVLKFSGCYHGHVDYLLVDAGSGLATFGTASSAGVPQDFAKLTASLPLDDITILEEAFAKLGDELACVVIEGVPANNGLLIQSPAYVKRLRELCDQYGTLLIFDEVLVGFRMPQVMAYKHYGIRPDLVVMGKVIGGGMPVGAYGGRADIMARISPLGDVYQAGTLSGNPVAMAAGHATLNYYFSQDVNAQLETIGSHLDRRMETALEGQETMGCVRLGSLFWLYFHAKEAPRTAEAISKEGAAVYAKLHRFLLDRNVYLAPSSYEVGFLNSAMTPDHIDELADGIAAAKEEGILS
jgi:glutamate-1-semialdehyde 2,1-aminomutase